MSDLVRVAAFPSAGELALHAAIELGLFAAHDLRVDLTEVPGSRPQFAGLREGRWDVLHTAADNVVAQREQGTDVAAVAGVNRGLLQLVARGDVTLAALPRVTIGVDSAASGYAVVLRHVLRRAGIEPRRCDFAEVGGTRERAAALAAGDIGATLLTPPYDVVAQEQGARTLLRPTDVVPRYVGATVAADRAWAAAHAPVLRRYLSALAEAQRWLRAPEHRDAAADIAARRCGAPPHLAGAVLDSVLDPVAGLIPDGHLVPADLACVIEIRRRDGQSVHVAADDCLALDVLDAV